MLTYEHLKFCKSEALKAERFFVEAQIVIDWNKAGLTMFKGPRHWIKYYDGWFLLNEKMYHVTELNACYHTILGMEWKYPYYDINIYGCWIETIYRMWRKDNGK